MEEIAWCRVSARALLRNAKRVANELRRCNVRLVFAESCTAGLLSATLAQFPGISQWLCGSAVVYRVDTKVQWLGVSVRDLQRHSAVSAPVTRQMSLGVLRHTPEADWSASVTGHFGPAAPMELDGIVFFAIASRSARAASVLECEAVRLTAKVRKVRQRQAVAWVLDRLYRRLHKEPRH